MPRSTAASPNPSSNRSGHRARRSAGGSLAAVALLAALGTAAAPSVITIQPGDTLWGLAREHGTTVGELQRLNDLGGSGVIYAGKTLVVRAAAPVVAAPRTHTVVAGETLSHLALRYGVSQRSLVEANGLASSGLIRIGQTLSIPGGTAAPTLAPETHNAGLTIPAEVRASVARNRAALAARGVPSKAEVQRMIAATARRHGVDPSLALAVAYQESGFQQDVVSSVDAIGVMQVLPRTGRNLSAQIGQSLDLLDTQDNITAGVLLLRQLLRSTGSEERALAGYYQGLGSIAARGVLPQTEQYLRNIAALRPRFAGA